MLQTSKLMNENDEQKADFFKSGGGMSGLSAGNRGGAARPAAFPGPAPPFHSTGRTTSGEPETNLHDSAADKAKDRSQGVEIGGTMVIEKVKSSFCFPMLLG